MYTRKLSRAWFINNLEWTRKIEPFLGESFFCVWWFFPHQNSFPRYPGNKPRERNVGSCGAEVQASVVPSFYPVGILPSRTLHAGNQG